MTTEEWQSKWYHRTCACCKRTENLISCGEHQRWCNVRNTMVHKDIPRPFCRMFEPKGDD